MAYQNALLVELDEELHFNRYRAATLAPTWAATLPWTDDYLAQCTDRESNCIADGSWGRRWSSPSTEALFGPPDEPGLLGVRGSPRWKQRALYGAMKDAAAIGGGGIALARMSVHDVVGGVVLGHALAGRAALDLDALATHLDARTTSV